MKSGYYLLDPRGILTGPVTAERLTQLGPLPGWRCSADRREWREVEVVVASLLAPPPPPPPPPVDEPPPVPESAAVTAEPDPEPAVDENEYHLAKHFAAVLLQTWNPAAARRILNAHPAGRTLKLSLGWLFAEAVMLAVEWIFFAPLCGGPTGLLSFVLVSAALLLPPVFLTAAAVMALPLQKEAALLPAVRLLTGLYAAAALSLALAPGVPGCQGWLRAAFALGELVIWGWFVVGLCRLHKGYSHT